MPNLKATVGARLTRRDPWAENHFLKCPGVLCDMIDRHAAQPGTIVDFGCGLGAKTIAMAWQFPQARVVGVDVTNAFRKADGILDTYFDGNRPPNLEYRKMTPGEALDIGEKPDVIYSWSVMEHIKRTLLPDVVRQLAGMVASGGIVITQIAPLFYSPFGSHLREFNDTPWAHLLLDHVDLRESLRQEGAPEKGVGSPRWMFSRYLELNKITAAELASYFDAAGLTTVHDDRKKTGMTPPEILRMAHDDDALRTFELLFVHGAGDPGGRARGTGLGRFFRGG